MNEAMVTGRMSAELKAEGNAVLERAKLNASQAINLLYEKLVEEQGVDWLVHRTPTKRDWQAAAKLVDSIPSDVPLSPPYRDMVSRKDMRAARLHARGLM